MNWLLLHGRATEMPTPGPDQVRWTTSTLYDLFVRFHQGLRWFCHAPPRTMTEYLLRPPQTSAVPVKTPPRPPPLVQVLRASQGHLEHLGSRLLSGYICSVCWESLTGTPLPIHSARFSCHRAPKLLETVSTLTQNICLVFLR